MCLNPLCYYYMTMRVCAQQHLSNDQTSPFIAHHPYRQASYIVTLSRGKKYMKKIRHSLYHSRTVIIRIHHRKLLRGQLHVQAKVWKFFLKVQQLFPFFEKKYFIQKGVKHKLELETANKTGSYKYHKIRQSSISYAGLLGRWDK